MLFGYYNPIFVMGPERSRSAPRPPASTRCSPSICRSTSSPSSPRRSPRTGVVVIPLVAPTSTPDRIDAARRRSRAPFVYYISLTGVTGAARRCARRSGAARAIRTAAGAPVAVGFGIRTPADAARFAAIADGVVVGSALVDQVAAGPAAGAADRVAALVRALAAAMPRAR